MNNIFIGLLLVFLDFTIDFDASKVGLIPDFIGYIFMIRGFAELTEHSKWFTKLRPYASGMAVYAGILYALDLLGVSTSLGLLSYPLGLISTIISLYITYGIVMGVRDMEIAYHWELNADSLMSIWRTIVAISIIMFLVIFIPIINIVGVIIALIFHIYFLSTFSKSKNMYYSQN